MNNSSPLVSVYIPTCKRIDLLHRALKSVREQTYSNIEIIVVVDGYDNETVSYLESVTKEDGRLRYVINPTNVGACVSRNKAIEIARGEFITGLDDDDYFLPDRIAQFVLSWPDADPLVVATYTDMVMCLNENVNKDTNKPSVVRKSDLIYRNFIGGQIFTRTESLRKFGGFDADFMAWQDLEYWFRILSNEDNSMRKVGNATYVVDTTHQYNRISLSRFNVIQQTYEHFCRKHKLNNKESFILYGQVLAYAPERMTFPVLLYSFIHARKLRAINIFLKLYIKSRFNIISPDLLKRAKR